METRADAFQRYYAQEIGANRPLTEARVRARLRADIDYAIHRHSMDRAQAHIAAGVRAGSLDNGSLDTDTLQQALDRLRAIPGGMADLSFAMGWAA